VISSPFVFASALRGPAAASGTAVDLRPSGAFVILVLDRDYLSSEMLPALARQHFRATGDGFDYALAVTRPSGELVYKSDAAFTPKAETRGDASVEFFQIRMQDFAGLVSEVRRFTAVTSSSGDRTYFRDAPVPPTLLTDHPSGSFSIVVQKGGDSSDGARVMAGMASTAATRAIVNTPPRWRLVIEHPSGSLESAVNAARRRNLAISSTILAVLGISVALLVVSTRRAQDLARQQLEFVATVSHELRTPLAVIRSAAENLADGVIDDQARIRQYGELVRSEGRRLSELVEQILEYAGLQAGQPLATTAVAMDALVLDAVTAIEPLARAAGVTIETHVAEGLGPVAGDEPALRRVLQNLLGNALKYGAGGRWIGVSARTAGGEVEVTVSDRGIGIATPDQARIFDPFYRAPEVVAAQIQGAGLGLSLVKRIVEAHRGRIAVKSSLGEGSAFIVTLPLASGDQAERHERVGAAAPQHS
jgi:signal transduction histidine kinase